MLKLKPKYIASLLLYAIPNTFLSFGIIYIINKVLDQDEYFITSYMGVVFVSLIGYTYLLNIVFQKHLNKLTFKLLYDNEKKIFGQILRAPLQKLEKLGSQRFYTAVEDLRLFAALPSTVTHTVSSILMLILGVMYMFSISTYAALIVIGLIGIIAVFYLLVMRTMSQYVAVLRRYSEDYFRYVSDVMKGFKLLKLNFFRRENLMNKHLIPNRNSAMDLDFMVNYVFLSINLISQYGLYFVIAVILFVLPEFDFFSRSEVIAYVVVILFISGPINNLINLQQTYTRFIVASRRLKNFVRDFEISKGSTEYTPLKSGAFNSLSFKDVEFTYYKDETDDKAVPFKLGPVNMDIKEGEVIFVVGGNGSGKSTFINILAGLYKPTSGQVLMNGVPQDKDSEEIQNLISAVFTEDHIFSKNFEEFELENNEQYMDLLKVMKMNEVIKDDKDRSVRRRFSKGQGKRLSLIFALLEKKPLLVLDEWAADQDPHYRKHFYEELIPRLKKEGKTIIAVTHDDAYFHIADRLIKFDYGNIVKDIQTTNKEELAENFWV